LLHPHLIFSPPKKMSQGHHPRFARRQEQGDAHLQDYPSMGEHLKSENPMSSLSPPELSMDPFFSFADDKQVLAGLAGRTCGEDKDTTP
jgi:hypothetical protein